MEMIKSVAVYNECVCVKKSNQFDSIVWDIKEYGELSSWVNSVWVLVNVRVLGTVMSSELQHAESSTANDMKLNLATIRYNSDG